MAVANVIQLFEEEILLLDKSSFDDDAAIALNKYHKDRITLELPNIFNDYVYKIRSNGYVGFIPVNDDYSLQILPKVSVKNIFGMLEIAYKQKIDFHDGITDVDFIEEVYERLAKILANKVLDRNIRGLFRDYIEKKDRLNYLRGRLDLLPTLKTLTFGSTSLSCNYHEQTADIIDNQIIEWTLYYLSRFPIKRIDVLQQVRKAYRELAGKVSLKNLSSKDCIGILYHRLNEDYRQIHGLCRFFLDQGGPGLEKGEYKFLPFVIYMPSLFESFVAEWLELSLPKGLFLSKQFRAYLDPESNFKFIIDLIIRNAKDNTPHCVVDTKYIRTKNPSEDNIQQIVAYAEVVGTTNAILVFPSTTTTERNLVVGKKNVQILNFDISNNLEESGTLFLGKLLSSIGFH